MTLTADIEKQLWNAADQLWTNSGLQPSEYSTPVLALIFLKYADHKFAEAEKKLATGGTRRRKSGASKSDYHAEGVMYLPEEARFQKLLNVPEGPYSGAPYEEKCGFIYEHVYASYWGDGQSKYGEG